MKPRTPKQFEITLISPEGKLVRKSDYFECPEEIIIGSNGISFDGWVFRTDQDIADSAIHWLGHQLEIIRMAQGAERTEAVVVALERLIRTPRSTANCHPKNRRNAL